MNEQRVRKIAAIVTRKGVSRTELLVFAHPIENGGISVQLPAGTVEPNETPEEAVIRELEEETGVRAHLLGLAGVRDEERDGEQRRRWVFLLRAPEGLPDEWPYTCDCGQATRCYWLPIGEAHVAPNQQPWLDLARDWGRASERR